MLIVSIFLVHPPTNGSVADLPLSRFPSPRALSLVAPPWRFPPLPLLPLHFWRGAGCAGPRFACTRADAVFCSEALISLFRSLAPSPAPFFFFASRASKPLSGTETRS